jgi:hypothetical protein
MRFHHVIATIIVLIIIASTAALVGQVTLIRLQRSIEFSVGGFRP